VLSIGKIALGQHRYYEQQVARGGDDYYSGRGEAPGEWVGAGAQTLGLSGTVSAAQFSALIAGQDPRDPSTRLRSTRRDARVAALDLTFSAPKSVSVLAAIASDEIAAELIVAHERAARAALTYLEDTALQVRRGTDGYEVLPGGGFIAAAYRHRMSRALDPQLHTHVVAANVTKGSDGRYSALHGTPLYRAAKTAGYLYQSHLRALITERLGLAWGPVHKGAAELADIPHAVLEEFSKRRRAMLEEARTGGIGLDTKAAGESTAIATRDRKQYGIATHTWREEVRARAAELGLGRREIAMLVGLVLDRETSGFAADGEQVLADHLAGPHGLTQRANTFDERDVLQAFADASESGTSVDDLRHHAERFALRGDVIALEDGEMTTMDLIEYERGLIASALEGHYTGHRVDGAVIPAAIESAPNPLTSDQAAAVRAIATSTQAVDVIEALAGTGKTYTAGVLRSLYERAGYKVIGVAPTARAARELEEQALIPARTLDRLLLDSDQLGEGIPARSIVIVDEAGMAPTRLSARLLAQAETAGAKVIAIGDPVQLPSVQAGGWLRAVGRACGAVRLTAVVRQREGRERTALAALRDGQPERYLEWANAAGRIEMLTDATAATRRAIDLWRRALGESGPASVVMIARDNDTREELNAAARELWGALGLLGEGRTYGALALAVGDRVICRQNDATLDVDNGMRGVVRELDGERAVIETDTGAVRELPAAYVDQHVEHAFALTGHSMQGGTVEQAIVVAAPRDLTAGWSYTALSRARGVTSLLIVDAEHDERSEFAPNGLTITRDPCLTRVARRMIERDDEDLAVERLRTREDPERPAERAEARLASRRRERLEDLEARAVRLTAERNRISAELAALPEPRRPFGRVRGEEAAERAHLAAIEAAVARELVRVHERHTLIGQQDSIMDDGGKESRRTRDHLQADVERRDQALEERAESLERDL
jgi:conjugative relaxase-like TrwC/TraI family protein